LTTSITWVHRDEISASLNKDNWFLDVGEMENLKVLLFGSGDRLDL